MNALEREIMEKFHQLQPAAKQRIRALIEQETVESVDSKESMSWVDFINATYGSFTDDPLEEIVNTHLPLPVRDEIE